MRLLFEQLGLTANEFRVLLAVLELASATPSELAQSCELGRTNVYPILDALQARRLVHQLPGSPARWATPGRDEVMDRLAATQAATARPAATSWAGRRNSRRPWGLTSKAQGTI